MLAAVVAEIFNNSRCVFAYLGAYRAFAVEYSHRVSFETPETRFAKLVLVFSEVCAKRLVIFFSALRAAYGVDFKLKTVNAEKIKNIFCKADNLRVGGWGCCADALNAELMKLPESPGLRLFIAVTAC